jgi:hypothetical protein
LRRLIDPNERGIYELGDEIRAGVARGVPIEAAGLGAD